MTELVFILDRSGSMAGLEADTIGGFNSMIARQKPPNCGNSPAARRASENADAICRKSNREASETQVLFL